MWVSKLLFSGKTTDISGAPGFCWMVPVVVLVVMGYISPYQTHIPVMSHVMYYDIQSGAAWYGIREFPGTQLRLCTMMTSSRTYCVGAGCRPMCSTAIA